MCEAVQSMVVRSLKLKFTCSVCMEGGGKRGCGVCVCVFVRARTSVCKH